MSLENKQSGASAGAATEATLLTVSSTLTAINSAPTDLGIIFQGNDGTGTYTDISAQSITRATLSAGVYVAQTAAPIATATPASGAKPGLSLWVSATFDTLTSFLIRVQSRRSAAEGWADIQSVRGDTGVTLAEHTIVPGDFTADKTVIQIGTASNYRGHSIRVLVKAVGVVTASGIVTVRGTT